jgi:hypothetical protein
MLLTADSRTTRFVLLAFYITDATMTHWRKIRALVNSKPLVAVNAIFAVLPILAIAISWANQFFGVGSLSPWLKLAYFASVIYILALVAYFAFCPELIKRYESELDRIGSEFEAYSRSNPDYRLEVTLTQTDARDPVYSMLVELSRERDNAFGENRIAIDSRIEAEVDKRWDHTVQSHLARTYEAADTSRPVARLAILAAWLLATLASVAFIIHRSIAVFSN